MEVDGVRQMEYPRKTRQDNVKEYKVWFVPCKCTDPEQTQNEKQRSNWPNEVHVQNGH